MNCHRGAPETVPGDPGYTALKEHLIASTGLAYYRDRDEDLAPLIGCRQAELGLPDCRAYLDFLIENHAGGAELDRLVTQLTIGETYFFRDQQQFDALRSIVLPEILERKRDVRQLRIWSAGCATGAEPYSLAILLGREMAQQVADWHISILATDINRHYLEQAAEGRFYEWAFRSTPPGFRQECFSQDGRGWRILPRHKQWIKFDHCNLVDRAFPSRRDEIADFDLILCRNVMIYFAHETTQRLIHQFHDALSHGGWFLVGAAEPNLESFTAFEQVHAAGTTIYRKTREKAAAGPPSREPSKSAGWVVAADSARCGGEPLAEAAESPHPLPAADPFSAATHLDRALQQEQAGRPAEAERCLRQAIYLDRHFVLAHYHLGLSLQKKEVSAAGAPRVSERAATGASPPGRRVRAAWRDHYILQPGGALA